MATDQLDFTVDNTIINGSTVAQAEFDLTLTVTGTTGSGTVTAVSGTADGYQVTGINTTYAFISESSPPDNQISTASPYVGFFGLSFDADGQAFNIFNLGTTYVGTEGNRTAEEATDISFAVTAVCYFPGTAIRTQAGDVAVEDLQIGDEVVTADGRVMPVRWIGRNTVSTIFSDPLRVLPIRIKAGALGEHSPERDLLVSPEHAVLVDGLLIAAGSLVNGLTITREKNVPETFTYYHVELAEHALIFAEGVPAESFVDNIHRMAFDNWEEHEALYGSSPIVEMSLPRAVSYRQVPQEIHDRLMARATAALTVEKLVA